MIELFHLVKQDTDLGATPSDNGKTNKPSSLEDVGRVVQLHHLWSNWG